MNYILVLIATVLLSFEFALSKKYQAREGADLTAALKFNMIAGIIKAVVFFAISGFEFQFSLFSLICAFVMSACAMAYSTIGFKVLKLGDTSTYSVFLMCGGMLLPYIYGIFTGELGKEKGIVATIRIAGIIIMLCAVILSANAKFKFNVLFFLLCISVFILNGCVSIVSKIHQVNVEFSPVDATAFVMYTGIFKFLISTVLLIFRKKEKQNRFLYKKSVWLIILIAAIGGLSYMLQLIGAKNLPATVLYPMITGGSIIFTSVVGYLFLKEKLSKRQIISVALCFIGTLFFL